MSLVVFTAGQSFAQQSTLPATERTSLVPQGKPVTPSPLPSANPVAPVSSRSDVVWDGSTLRIEANNAGLNELLQEIARKTGLRLTGSAPEERIFGRYGPGSLNDVVSRLLDGVSVNVLLLNRSGAEGNELVLTGRSGRPTPPNASARDDAAPEPTSPGAPGPSGYGRSVPVPVAAQQPAGNGPPADANATQGSPAADGAQPASPNGVKTPQEIYEQLQRLRSQQAK